MKFHSITLSILLISTSVNIITCQNCGREDYQKCIAFADPLLKDPHLIFPDNVRDIDIVCRKWSNFVNCIKRYIERCFSKQRIDQFNAAVEAPIASVHQMCAVSTYQAEYLRYASCLKATVTEPQHCRDEYASLVEEVSKGEMARANLCCSHHHFRKCVIIETRKRCDHDNENGAASRYSRQILDRALNFLQDQCQSSTLNHNDCHNLVTDNAISLSANSLNGKSINRDSGNNNRRPHYRTLMPDNYIGGQGGNFYVGATNTINNPSSFRSTSRSLNELPKNEELDKGDASITDTSSLPHQTTEEVTDKIVASKITEETEMKTNQPEEEIISTARQVIDEPAIVVTQRSSNYGRGMSWTSSKPRTTTEIPSWATNTWATSNQEPVTDSWYPDAGSFGGNNIDEPNQQGLKNGQMHLQVNLLLSIIASFTFIYI